MNPSMAAAPTIILAGPTGVGKSDVALALARRRPLELILADSMQIYRGMEIGTAQPGADQLGGIALHCCGVLQPDEPFSVKKYLDMSDRARKAIIDRGARPLYVGGTGMYLRALRWGLFETPEIDPAVRARLQAEIDELGSETLHERLEKRDRAAAAKIAPQDAIRIVRALEVIESTGQRIGSLQTQWKDRCPRFDHRLIVLSCPRPTLVRRIENRIDRMLAGGWIEEVRALLDSGYSPRLHCFKALGYREIAEYLDGAQTKEQTAERIKARTRQFSRRQLTWLRKEPDAHWIDYDPQKMGAAIESIEKILDSVS